MRKALPRTQSGEEARVPGKKAFTSFLPQPTTWREVKAPPGPPGTRKNPDGSGKRLRAGLQALGVKGIFRAISLSPPSSRCLPFHQAGCVCIRPVTEPSLPLRLSGTLLGQLWLSWGSLRISEPHSVSFYPGPWLSFMGSQRKKLTPPAASHSPSHPIPPRPPHQYTEARHPGSVTVWLWLANLRQNLAFVASVSLLEKREG